MFTDLNQLISRKVLDNLRFFFRQTRWAVGLSWKIMPRAFLLIVVFSILTSLIPAIQVIIARTIINVAIAVINGNAATQQLYTWVFIGLGITILQALISTGKNFANQLINARMSIELNIAILEKAAAMDITFFENPTHQDTLERASRNPAASLTTFLNSAQTTLIKVVQGASLVTVLIVLAPSFAALLAVLFIPFAWFQWRLSRQAYNKEFSRATRRRWNRYFASRLTSRNNIPEIKFLDLAQYLIDKYRGISNEFYKEDHRIFWRGFILQGIFALLSTVVIYLMLLNVVNRVVSGILTVGDIALFTGAAFRLRDVIESSVSSASTSWQNVLYVSDTTSFLEHPHQHSASAGVPLTSLAAPIRFEDVSFSYPGTTKKVLHNISIEIHPGETLAIVGPNGAGKSTLAYLLARLYLPTLGRITLDDVDIQSFSLESYYQRIAVVSQTFNTYEGTVIENIGYGDWRNLLDNPLAVQAIAERAELHEMIDAMPDKYDTMLGRTFGTYDLSRGQWQQIALLRAFAHGGDLLILDEPTASIDLDTEHKLYMKFAELAEQRTAILISHRLSTINIADRIIVLDDGRVIESGTHAELLAAPDGYYSRLYTLHMSQLGV